MTYTYVEYYLSDAELKAYRADDDFSIKHPPETVIKGISLNDALGRIFRELSLISFSSLSEKEKAEQMELILSVMEQIRLIQMLGENHLIDKQFKIHPVNSHMLYVIMPDKALEPISDVKPIFRPTS